MPQRKINKASDYNVEQPSGNNSGGLSDHESSYANSCRFVRTLRIAEPYWGQVPIANWQWCWRGTKSARF